MIKNLLAYLGYGWFAEIALVLFFLIFAAIIIRTLLTPNETTDQQAKIVLDDSTEKPS